MRFLQQRGDARDLGRRLRRARQILVRLASQAVRDVGRLPARMSTPGAVTSGFKKLRVAQSDGPRDEKSATTLPSPDSDAKMPRASRTVTRSSSVSMSSSSASAARRSTSTLPSALLIMTAGMPTLPVSPFMTIGAPDVVVDHDGDRAGVLGVADLDLELAAAALDERDAAVHVVAVRRAARTRRACCPRVPSLPLAALAVVGGDERFLDRIVAATAAE